MYSWIGGDRPEDVRQGALKLYETGCTAVKMNGTEEMHYVDSYEKIQEVVNRVASIREALGYKMDIGVDFHGRVHKTMAKVLAKELEPFKLMFIEEPVPVSYTHLSSSTWGQPIFVSTADRGKMSCILAPWDAGPGSTC